LPRAPRSSRRLMATVILWAMLISHASAQTDAYVIGPDDVLDIVVWNQADLTGRFPVGSDGSLTFPLLGRVPAAGLTVRKLELQLTRLLSEGFLRQPQVAVTVETYRSRQIFIVGEVRQPGTFYLSGQETLLQALARAGSTTPTAGDEVLIVRPKARVEVQGPLRPDEHVNDVLRVNLEKLQMGTLDQTIVLQHGDTIFVPKAETVTVYVVGQVRNPGAYNLTKGLTVLQALSLAGGLTDRGASGRIKIVRQVNGDKREVRVDLSEVVQPNDTVVVPERFF
jgi:polysaccharide biosynthesis/export protein